MLKSLIECCTIQLRTMRHITIVLTKILSKDIELTLQELLKLNPQPHHDVLKSLKGELLPRYGELVLTNPLRTKVNKEEHDKWNKIDSFIAHFESDGMSVTLLVSINNIRYWLP